MVDTNEVTQNANCTGASLLRPLTFSSFSAPRRLRPQEDSYQTGAKVGTCAKQPPEDDAPGADPSRPVPAAAGAAAPEQA